MEGKKTKKTMVFKENFPITYKIVVQSKILAKILNFKYLVCNVSFRGKYILKEKQMS